MTDDHEGYDQKLGAWIVIGAGVGAAIGAAIDNIGVGLGVGIAIGVAIGVGHVGRRSDESQSAKDKTNDS